MLGIVPIFFLTGGMFFYWGEDRGWSYMDAIWFGFTSSTTIGFGDLTPSTGDAVGMTLEIIWVLFGLILVGALTKQWQAMVAEEVSELGEGIETVGKSIRKITTSRSKSAHNHGSQDDEETTRDITEEDGVVMNVSKVII